MSDRAAAILHVTIILLFGIIIVPMVLKEPLPEDFGGLIHAGLFSLVGLGIGSFAAIFPKKFNAGNQRRFEKLYEKTKFPLFKRQAEGTSRAYMVPFVRAGGILFVVIAAIYLFKIIGSLV